MDPIVIDSVDGIRQSLEHVVLQHIREAIDSIVPPGDVHDRSVDAVDRAAVGFASRAAGELLPIHLPQAIGGPAGFRRAAEGVAAACTAVYLGGRLLDDLMDGHEPSLAPGATAGDQVVLGAAFLSGIPQIIIAELPRPPEVRVRLLAEVARGLGRLGDGQARDAKTFGAIVTPEEVIRAAEGKTGWLIGSIARMAAVASDWAPADVDLIGRVGVTWGVARQITLDCHRLLVTDHRRVEQRACSYPVALHHASLSPPERVSFEAIYRRFVEGRIGTEELAEELAATSALERSRLVAEVQLASAQAQISTSEIDPAIRAELDELIDGVPTHRKQEP